MAVSRNPHGSRFSNLVTSHGENILRHIVAGPVVLEITKVSKLPPKTYNEIPEVSFKSLNQTKDTSTIMQFL